MSNNFLITRHFYSIILKLCVVLVFLSSCVSASSNAAAFLETVIQPRPAGLGMSYTSIAKGADAVIWNPANLGNLTFFESNIGFTRLFETDYIHVQLAYPFPAFGFGISYIHAGISGIEASEIGPNHTYTATGETLSFQGDAVFIGVGKPLTSYLNAGLTIKLISERTSPFLSYGIGIDSSLLYTFQEFSAGIMFQNILSPEMRWNTPSSCIDTVPFQLKTGICYSGFKDFNLTVELSSRKNRKEKWHYGIEYAINPMLNLRSGINNNSLCLGFGLNVKPMQFDFSWEQAPETFLSSIYRFSIGYFL
ncbi:hypothetical protein ACFL96_00365 [Thermoproteota archaeon]